MSMMIIKKVISAVIFILVFYIAGCSFEDTSTVTHDIPNTPTPPDGAIDQALDFNLTWFAEEAISYDLYFDEGVNPPVTLARSGITQNYIRVPNPPLKAGSTYYWKIIAEFSDGSTEEGEVWSFTTVPPQAGYKLLKYNFTTAIPNIVDLKFQVVDLEDKGVSGLTVNNFQLLDDGQPLPSFESHLLITNLTATAYEIKTVLMLDNSASLSPDEIETIRNSAADFINNIVPNQTVAIYSFSEDIEPLKFDFSSNKDELLDSLSLYQWGEQSTNLYGAVMVGVSRWEDDYSLDQIEQGMMVIFTDGKDTQAAYTIYNALSAIGTKLVYSIGLGYDIDPEILEQIGTAGFYRIDNIDQLTTQLAEIQNEIIRYANSFYWMQYYSPRRGDRYHTITLSFINNGYVGPGATITDIYNSKNFY